MVRPSMTAALSPMPYRIPGESDDHHHPHPASQRARLLPGPSGRRLAGRIGAAAQKACDEDLVLTDFCISFSAVS
jgi:hypothetical protein